MVIAITPLPEDLPDPGRAGPLSLMLIPLGAMMIAAKAWITYAALAGIDVPMMLRGWL